MYCVIHIIRLRLILKNIDIGIKNILVEKKLFPDCHVFLATKSPRPGGGNLVVIFEAKCFC